MLLLVLVRQEERGSGELRLAEASVLLLFGLLPNVRELRGAQYFLHSTARSSSSASSESRLANLLSTKNRTRKSFD